MTGKQQAVVVKEIGEPVQLGVRDVPTPKEGQVLLKVKATMILPHDTYGRDWGMFTEKRLPAVLGSNVAGVIEKVGASVPFGVGERVFGMSYQDPISSDQAGLQEYAVLNANAIGKTPEEFSDEQVATLPINLCTSWTVLFTGTGFDFQPPFVHLKDLDNAGQSIVIIGGGTNVGQFAVQLAHIAGIGRIIVIAGPSNNEQLKSMGATHVIDRHNSPEDIVQQIHAVTGPEGVTQVYSCAQLQVDLVVAILSAKRPSKLRLLLPFEGDQEDRLSLQRPLCDASFVDDMTNDSLAPYTEQFWTEVPNWLRTGKILPTKYEVIQGLENVEKINDALDAYRDFARPSPQTVVKVGE